MNIIDLSRGVLTQGWMVCGLSPKVTQGYSGLSAVFFLKATYKLRNNDVPVPWEKGPELVSGDLMIQDDPAKGLGYASDYAPYKPLADFSVVGTAYPPGSQITSFLASVTVGSVTRAVGVVGERSWQGGVLSDKPGPPSPAKPTTLSYDNAWGGVKDETNPLGIGRDGEKMAFLELPASPVLSREDRRMPALFAPMFRDSPFRKSKMGTYDEEWLKTRWPWFPKDFDYSFFNAAPPSQWFPQPLSGNEELVFENMHPEIPTYKSKLPGVQARCFLSRVTNWEIGLPEERKQREFREVTMKLDTIWADLDQEKLILVWRGNTPCETLKFHEIEHLVTALEPSGVPQTQGYYQNAWKAVVAAQAEKSTLMEEEFFAADQSPAGTDPDDGPSLEGSTGVANLSRPTLSLGEIKTKGMEDQDLRNHDFSGLDLSFVNFRGALLAGASFVKSKLVGTDFTGADMTGVDLRNADLTSAILNGCDLRKSDVAGTIWEKCSLDGAVMASLVLVGVNFSGAKGERCDFSRSSLKNAKLQGAAFIQCDFSGAILDRADFSGGKLTQCNFRKASAVEVIMKDCDLGNIRASDADFTGACFERSKGDLSVWEGAKLDKAKFMTSSFSRARFSLAIMRDADFERAILTESVFEDALLPRAKMRNANLLRAVFTGADLTEASLDGSNLYGSDFWNAVIRHATWNKANVGKTRLET